MEMQSEIQELAINLQKGYSVQAIDLRQLVQNHQWSQVWSALAFGEFRCNGFEFLMKLQQLIRFPERSPAYTLRTRKVLDQQLTKDIWRYKIIPYLTLKEQLRLSQTCLYLFQLSSDLYVLKNEFPAFFKDQLLRVPVFTLQNLLSTLKALAYPDPKQHLGSIFSGIVKNISPSEFLDLPSSKWLNQWVMEERNMDCVLHIEKVSPLTLSIILDKLSTMLFFLNCVENTTSLLLHKILKTCCQYGATTILQFFLWALPTNKNIKYDPYLPIACENRHLSIVRLLAPRVHSITLTMCLITLGKDSLAIQIVECIKAHGGRIPEEVESFGQWNQASYSKLLREIISADLADLLSLLIKRWPQDFQSGYPSTIFYHIFNYRYGTEILLLDVIAFLLSRSKSIQIKHDAVKSFSKFFRVISTSDKLYQFLSLYIPKWNVNFLSSSRFKLITAVCRSGHIENFKVLLNNGVAINDSYTSKKHVLSSPLSLVAFSYSRSQPLFNFLIENWAVFTPLAVCHAVIGGQLAGVQALMRLPDAVIPNNSLEHHPLFVAAQFGKLDCFDFLMSQGITLSSLSIDQLWDFLIQGPIAALLRLRDSKASAAWQGPLYKMRSRLLMKMLRVEIGRKYGFPEADPFEFSSFLQEKSEVYLNIISIILPYVREKILDNTSILFIALSTGNVKLLLLLLVYSPAIDALDEDGHSSLLHAVRLGNVKMVSVLLEHGANIQIQHLHSYLSSASIQNPEILALLINSRQYTLLNFSNFPDINLCLSCLPYLTEKSGNPIIPPLAEIMYELYRIHPDMVPLQKIFDKIKEYTIGDRWNESGFSRIVIDNISYSAPGIIAEIYHRIVHLYSLSYPEAINLLPTVYQSIHALTTNLKGFRLRFHPHSSTTLAVCHLIESWIPKRIDHFSNMRILNASCRAP